MSSSTPMRLTFLSLFVWLLAVSPAGAWNWTGHKIIASIAFRQLAADEQTRIVELLQRHPRFTEDFADAMPEEVRGADTATQSEWLFQQAAVWPDLVRPPGPEAKIAYNRGTWHYINVPHFLDDAARSELKDRLTINLALEPPPDATTNTEELNIVQVIRLARARCADAKADPMTRGLLLAWLMHDVGDLHQPLHATAMFSRRLFPMGDRGGNSIKTTQAFNLHSVWDQFPGRDDRLGEARNAALQLLQDVEHAAAGKRAAAQPDEQVWVNESHQIAGQSAYDVEVLAALRRMEVAGSIEPIELSESYLKASGQIAKRRLVEAGFRLGSALKQVVAE